jgi:hypothetical protein
VRIVQNQCDYVKAGIYFFVARMASSTFPHRLWGLPRPGASHCTVPRQPSSAIPSTARVVDIMTVMRRLIANGSGLFQSRYAKPEGAMLTAISANQLCQLL